MGDDLVGDGLNVAGPIFFWAGDTEDDVPSSGVDVLLQPPDALLRSPQQTVVLDNADKVTAVKIAATQGLGGYSGGLFHSWVN